MYGVCSSQEDRGTTEMGSCLLWERTALDGLEDTAEKVAVMEVGQLGSWTPRQLCLVCDVGREKVLSPVEELWSGVGRP